MTDHFDWTEAAIRYLREAWPTTVTTANIGRVIGVSKNAVVGKAHRLDLDARPSPILRAQPYGPTWPPPAKRIEPPPLLTFAPAATARGPDCVPVLLAFERPAATAAAPVVTEPSRPIVRRLNAAGCCWLTGEKPYVSCTEPAEQGLPYCEAHADRAYVRGSITRRAAQLSAQAGRD